MWEILIGRESGTDFGPSSLCSRLSLSLSGLFLLNVSMSVGAVAGLVLLISLALSRSHCSLSLSLSVCVCVCVVSRVAISLVPFAACWTNRPPGLVRFVSFRRVPFRSWFDSSRSFVSR